MKNIGLYIHIPFCKSKCPYCDFYSLRADGVSFNAYTDGVLKSLELWAQKLGRKADTLYLGGGTPSLIGGENIAKIVLKARELFGVDGEITVECNPSALEDDFFKTVAAAGINRISLGMQSAVDSERKKLGRLADSARVSECIAQAREAGIDNISLDVMLGVPDQTAESLAQTARFCVESSVPHVSAYMLKLEEGTYYYNNASKFNLPDDDTVADMYTLFGDFLEENGFINYEISNFAKKGFEGQHNLKYWCAEEYLGIGPSAHSFVGGERFYYPRSLEHFISGGEVVADGDGGDEDEYIMLRLRLKDGVMFSDFKARFGKDFPAEIMQRSKKFESRGLVRADSHSLSLTREGFLLSNTIISDLLS